MLNLIEMCHLAIRPTRRERFRELEGVQSIIQSVHLRELREGGMVIKNMYLEASPVVWTGRGTPYHVVLVVHGVVLMLRDKIR